MASLNLELFGDFHGLLFLDAEVAGGILDGLVSEENLGDAEIGCLAVDVGDTGAPE